MPFNPLEVTLLNCNVVLAIRRTCLWFALIALTFLTLLGIYNGRLFSQGIWTPQGLEKLFLLAAVYAGFSALFLAWKPTYFPLAAAVAVAGYTVFAVGPQAIAAVVFFLFSSLVIGEWLFRGDPLLACLLGISIYMSVLSVGVRMPVNYPLFYVVVLAAPLIWRYQRTLEWLVKAKYLVRPIRFPNRAEQFATAALVFVLVVHWLVVLEPETGVDALAMHLAVPSSVAALHYWPFDVRNHLWAVMPMGGDWCYTIVYLLGGEAAARLLNFSFLLAVVFLLRRATRSSLIAALFAATPVAFLVTGSLFVENYWTLLAFAALISLVFYRERGEESYLYVSCVFLGAAAATKFGALAFVPAMAPIAAWLVWKSPGSKLRKSAAGIGLFVLLAAPPYVTAYLKTGNPVFPFLNGPASPKDARFQKKPALNTLADLTFHSSKYMEAQDGAAGFQYFLLLPLGLVLLRRDWEFCGIAAGLVLIVFAVITMNIQANLRYLYAGCPFAMLFIASSLAALKNVNGRLYRIVIVLSSIVLCLNVYFLGSADWTHKDLFTNPASALSRSDYLAAHAPVRVLVDLLNRKSAGMPVAFLETNAIAGLRAPAYTNMWHTPDFPEYISSARSASDCLQLMRKYGIRFVIFPYGYRPHTTPVQTFLKQCTAPESRSGTFIAARVRAGDACISEMPPTVAPHGEYDDADDQISFQKAWVHGEFPNAWQHTVTFTDIPGASFRFSFLGSEITYVYTKAFNRGTAEVLIDGSPRASIALYSPAVAWQAETRFSCPGPGPHIIEVRNIGNGFIDVDALRVR